MYESSIEHLNEIERAKLKQFLIEYSDIFSKDDWDIGLTSLGEHHIETGDAKPLKFPPRRMAPEAREAADKIVDQLLQRGLIRPSKSAWSAPLVMIRKKDKERTFRLCCDFRVTCYSVSKSDAFPQPRIDETLESLSKAKFFSVGDLSSGYWQIPMAKDSIEKTGFSCHKGLFEWLRMLLV